MIRLTRVLPRVNPAGKGRFCFSLLVMLTVFTGQITASVWSDYIYWKMNLQDNRITLTFREKTPLRSISVCMRGGRTIAFHNFPEPVQEGEIIVFYDGPETMFMGKGKGLYINASMEYRRNENGPISVGSYKVNEGRVFTEEGEDVGKLQPIRMKYFVILNEFIRGYHDGYMRNVYYEKDNPDLLHRLRPTQYPDYVKPEPLIGIETSPVGSTDITSSLERPIVKTDAVKEKIVAKNIISEVKEDDAAVESRPLAETLVIETVAEKSKPQKLPAEEPSIKEVTFEEEVLKKAEPVEEKKIKETPAATTAEPKHEDTVTVKTSTPPPAAKTNEQLTSLVEKSEVVTEPPPPVKEEPVILPKEDTKETAAVTEDTKVTNVLKAEPKEKEGIKETPTLEAETKVTGQLTEEVTNRQATSVIKEFSKGFTLIQDDQVIDTVLTNDDAKDTVKRWMRIQTENELKSILEDVDDTDVEVDQQGIKIVMGKELFELDSYVMNRRAVKILDAIIPALDRYSRDEIIIEGHTLNIGSKDYSQKLTENRAHTICKYLQDKLPNLAHQISYVGYGYSKPLVETGTPEEMDKNRRMVILIK